MNRPVRSPKHGVAPLSEKGIALEVEIEPSTNTDLDEALHTLSLLDTAAISDALDSLGIAGWLKGVRPRVTGTRMAGRAFTVRYRELHDQETRAFQGAANYIDDVAAGSVIVSVNEDRPDCTTWGNLLTAVAETKAIAGTVIVGNARDIAEIRSMAYPLFSTGVSMVSGKNRVKLDQVQVELVIDGVAVRPGDFVVGDDNGVLVIPATQAVEVARRAHQVDRTEAAIVTEIRQGTPLHKARSLHGYSKPWEATQRNERSRDTE